GVQTCALPICWNPKLLSQAPAVESQVPPRSGGVVWTSTTFTRTGTFAFIQKPMPLYAERFTAPGGVPIFMLKPIPAPQVENPVPVILPTQVAAPSRVSCVAVKVPPSAGVMVAPAVMSV